MSPPFILPILIRVRADTNEVDMILQRDTGLVLKYGAFGLTDELRTKIVDQHHTLRNIHRRTTSGETVDVDALGKDLGNILFDQGLRYAFFEWYSTLPENGRLRIQLDFHSSDQEWTAVAAALPWELCIIEHPDTSERTIRLSTAEDIVFCRGRSRDLDKIRPIRVSPRQKIKIALVIAAPTGADPDHPESRPLAEVYYNDTLLFLRTLDADYSDRIELTVFEDSVEKPTNLQRIQEALETEPDILHFIGHGKLKEDGGHLALTSSIRRSVAWHSCHDFAEKFETYQPRIVLMQSCETAAATDLHVTDSIAYQLFQRRVPVVVAMQYEVTTATADEFVEDFYTDLVIKRHAVDYAVQRARQAIRQQRLSTRGSRGVRHGAFATPVVFSDLNDCRFVLPKDEFKPAEISQQDVLKTLWTLDYDDQTFAFGYIDSLSSSPPRVCGALVSGQRYTGHLWLLNRLVLENDMWRDDAARRHNWIDLASLGIENTLGTFWYRVGTAFSVTVPPIVTKTDRQRVIEAIVRQWHVDSVLFVLDNLHRVPSEFIQQIVKEFWKPLVEHAQEDPSESENAWLLLFMLDRENLHDPTQAELADWFSVQNDWQPVTPLRMEALDTQFDTAELEQWVVQNVKRDNVLHPFIFAQKGDGNQIQLAAQALMRNGTQPENILDEIYWRVTNNHNKRHTKWLRITND